MYVPPARTYGEGYSSACGAQRDRETETRGICTSRNLQLWTAMVWRKRYTAASDGIVYQPSVPGSALPANQLSTELVQVLGTLSQ
eukprot:1910981-Rhodomonas_salina.2